MQFELKDLSTKAVSTYFSVVKTCDVFPIGKHLGTWTKSWRFNPC